jgi:hypothetical protein
VSERKKRLDWSQILTLTGVSIALLNMILAWVIMYERRDVTFRSVDQGVAGQNIFADLPEPEARAYLEATFGAIRSIIETSRRPELQRAQYGHRKIVLVLAFCFGLTGIGFSLFVMGVKSAVSVQAEAGKLGALLMKAASPGIVCILCGTVIVGLAITKGMDFTKEEAEAQARLMEAAAKLEEATTVRILKQIEADAKLGRPNHSDPVWEGTGIMEGPGITGWEQLPENGDRR